MAHEESSGLGSQAGMMGEYELLMLAGRPSLGPFFPPARVPEAPPRVPVVQDWARLVSFEPSLYFKPRDQEELESFLGLMARGAFKQNRIRVPGSLHSCSKILVSDAILDTSALPRELDFGAGDSTVTVSSNWRLHDILLELGERGRSLPATGGTDAQTLAGLLSTNTAPASSRYALFDALEWVEYLTLDPGTGDVVVRRVSRGEPGFSSVVCSLGAIGIITRMHFSLVEQPFFRTLQKVVPLDEVLDDVEATSRQYDFWRIDWLPDMKRGLLWAATKVPPEQADPHGDYRPDQAVNVLQFIFMFWDKFSGGASGPLLGNLEKVVYKVLADVYGTTKATGPLRNMLPVDRRAPLRVAMAEWSFDPADLPRVREECKDYFEQSGWPNMPIEIELTKTDGYHMSPWNWPGLEYVVKFNFMYLTDVCRTEVEREGIITHLRGLWAHLTQAGIRFKAHWGKINFMDHAFVRANHAFEQFEPFIHPLFLNEYLAERLLPPT